MRKYKFKLTTECGFHWDWEHIRYWRHGWKPRLLTIDKTGEHIGVASGPVMFFWKFM